MVLEYEFTVVTQPHRGYGRFVHVDAMLDEPAEILRYVASSKDYPCDVPFGMEIQEGVEYAITELSPATFDQILAAWRELSELTISQFAWRAVSEDQTPFDRLVDILLEC